MPSRSVLTIYLILFAVHVGGILLIAFRANFPTQLDEQAHYSYIAEMRETPTLVPRYESMRLINLEDGSWSAERNYLNHPPLYYLLMSVLPFDVLSLRLANVVISALAVGLLCFIGLRAFADPMQHVIFASGVALCPKAQLMGGQINNDNLAFLAGAVVLFALTREQSTRIAVQTGFGFVLGALSKLTAGLILGLLLAFSHLSRIRALPPRYFAILGAFALVGTAPYLLNLAVYDAPLFINKEFIFIPESERLQLGLGEFILHFLRKFFTTWGAFEPAMVHEIIPFLIILGLSLASKNKLVVSGLVTLAAVMLINFVFMYRIFLETGHTAGMSFRYYLPLWPVLVLGASSGAARLPQRARVVTAFCLMTLLAISSVSVANILRT
jgi:hypothetical protein